MDFERAGGKSQKSLTRALLNYDGGWLLPTVCVCVCVWYSTVVSSHRILTILGELNDIQLSLFWNCPAPAPPSPLFFLSSSPSPVLSSHCSSPPLFFSSSVSLLSSPLLILFSFSSLHLHSCWISLLFCLQSFLLFLSLILFPLLLTSPLCCFLSLSFLFFSFFLSSFSSFLVPLPFLVFYFLAPFSFSLFSSSPLF